MCRPSETPTALPPEVSAAHLAISPVDLRFREVASRHPELLRRSTFAELDRSNPLLRYPLQAWPTFIGREKLAEFAGLATALSGLIRSIPERVFDNDPGRIARFYGDDEDYIRLMMAPPSGIAGALSRGDFLYTRDGFQCIEFNIASSLGGWETAILADILFRVPAIARFLRENGLRVSFRNTLRLTLQHAAREAREQLSLGGNEINVAFESRVPAGMVSEAASRFLAAEYQAALAELDPSLSGTVVIAPHSDMLESQGTLRLRDGRRIHAVIELHADESGATVFRSFKRGQLVLFNGPARLLLSDKRNLAILSENAESDLFDAQERRLIQERIPWIRRVLPGPVSHHGEQVSLEDHVLARRESLVLKKARSLGGEHVVLGRFTPPEEWRAALRSALESGDWVVQDYVESLPYLFQNGREGCSQHDVVWGPFVFGTVYSGAILRLQPKALEGIVNLTRGASEGILLEIESTGA